MYKWPKIPQFHGLLRDVNARKEYYASQNIEYNPVVQYRPKVKIHGTNSSIVLQGSNITAQSRNNVLTENKDNAGFRSWVQENVEWCNLVSDIPHEDTIIVFGEWAGIGIQSGTAINQLNRKVFCVFALYVDDRKIYDPDAIRDLLPDHEGVHVIPYLPETYTVYFNDKNSIEEFSKLTNNLVNKIQEVDPFVKESFGIEGTGEGIVFYPLEHSFSKYAFKAKIEKFAVERQRSPVTISPEKSKSIDDFVNRFLTEERLLQGLSEIGPWDIKNTGKFVKWVSQDIFEESKYALEDSGLDWKDVCKSINRSASLWWRTKE